MSLSQTPAPKAVPAPSALSHIHATGETCPTCDQPIPHDRSEEIKEKIQARQSAQAIQIAARLQDQFRREKADAVEQAKREAATALAESVASARAEERQAADAAANQRLAEVERANALAQAALQARLDKADTAKATAEQSSSALQTELAQMRRDHGAEIQRLHEEAEAGAVKIREEAATQARAAVQDELAGMVRSRQESEAALQARIMAAELANSSAQETNADLLEQLQRAHTDNDAAIEKSRQEADTRVNIARQEATAAAEAAARARVAGAEQAREEAEAKARTAQEQNQELQEMHAAQLDERLLEQREALERSRTEAVNAEKQAAFDRELKLQTKLEDVQRMLDHKTAEEQGEGAEVNLLEDLKAEFTGDKFEHVGKGNAGADIIHTVIHNGVECGTIIYDSKDHNQWRYDFTTKLASDKIAAKADHAILSVRKFPQGARQLHIHDGVIIANPARVLVLVHVVREHIVKSHALRLSNEAKAQKSAELYAFITSAQFTDLLNRIDTHAQELQELQDGERKAHENLWKKQSILLRSIQKAGADLTNRVDIIIGTAAHEPKAVNDE